MSSYSLDTFYRNPMFFDPSSITIAQLTSSIRDMGFVVALIVGGWKSRAFIQPVVDFFNQAKTFMARTELHMTSMENSMSQLLNNHLSHLKRNEIQVAEAAVAVSEEVKEV